MQGTYKNKDLSNTECKILCQWENLCNTTPALTSIMLTYCIPNLPKPHNCQEKQKKQVVNIVLSWDFFLGCWNDSWWSWVTIFLFAPGRSDTRCPLHASQFVIRIKINHKSPFSFKPRWKKGSFSTDLLIVRKMRNNLSEGPGQSTELLFNIPIPHSKFIKTAQLSERFPNRKVAT